MYFYDFEYFPNRILCTSGKCPESQKYIESFGKISKISKCIEFCWKMFRTSEIQRILWEDVQNGFYVFLRFSALSHMILCISEILDIFPQDYMYF
jgi:hypothetical protein